MKVGLSFSKCILDIYHDRVLYEDVFCIVAGTRMESRDKIESVINSNYGTFADCQEIIQLAYKLWDEGRIHQPRLFGTGVHAMYGYPTALSADLKTNWMDLIVADYHTHPTVKRAWETYQLALKLAQDKVD